MSHHDCRYVCLLSSTSIYIAPKTQFFFGVLGVSEVFCTVLTIVRTKHETCGLKVRKIFGLADILSEVLKKNENTAYGADGAGQESVAAPVFLHAAPRHMYAITLRHGPEVIGYGQLPPQRQAAAAWPRAMCSSS